MQFQRHPVSRINSSYNPVIKRTRLLWLENPLVPQVSRRESDWSWWIKMENFVIIIVSDQKN